MKKLFLIIILLYSPLFAESLQMDHANSDIDMSYINTDPVEDDYNWGNDWGAWFGTGSISNGYEYRPIIRFIYHGDTLANHSGVTWDSAQIVFDIEFITGFSTNDSLGLCMYAITESGWIEGSGTGSDAGGVTSDSAVDATGGASGLDWTNGGAFAGTPEGDTVWIISTMVIHDSVFFTVSGASVSDTANGGGGFIIKSERYVTAGNSLRGSFHSDRQNNEGWRPHANFFYTVGGATITKRRKILFGNIIEKGEGRNDGKVVVGEMIDWDKDRLVIEGATR